MLIELYVFAFVLISILVLSWVSHVLHVSLRFVMFRLFVCWFFFHVCLWCSCSFRCLFRAFVFVLLVVRFVLCSDNNIFFDMHMIGILLQIQLSRKFLLRSTKKYVFSFFSKIFLSSSSLAFPTGQNRSIKSNCDGKMVA